MAPSQSTILEPKFACRSGRKEDPIECSLHVLPKQLLREFQHVFGENYLSMATASSHGDSMDVDTTSSSSSPLEMLAIPTNQHARHDLVAMGDEIEEEKDRLLNCVGYNHQRIVQICHMLSNILFMPCSDVFSFLNLEKNSVVSSVNWVTGPTLLIHVVDFPC
jgi:hypothetical protein